jgi:hypothetical protein
VRWPALTSDSYSPPPRPALALSSLLTTYQARAIAQNDKESKRDTAVQVLIRRSSHLFACLLVLRNLILSFCDQMCTRSFVSSTSTDFLVFAAISSPSYRDTHYGNHQDQSTGNSKAGDPLLATFFLSSRLDPTSRCSTCRIGKLSHTAQAVLVDSTAAVSALHLQSFRVSS